MNEPDIIEQLVARLQAECPGLVTVEEAWFAAPLDHFDSQTPAAMPYLAEDIAPNPPQTTRPVQGVTLTYGLWLVCKRSEFRAQRVAIRRALFGHVFGEQHNPMAYRGGEANDIRGELIWWREFWTVGTWLRHGAS